MIEGRRSLFDLLGFLRGAGSFSCTPFNFLRVLREAASISLTDSRELMSMFDPGWRPNAPAAEVEQKWVAVLSGRS